MLASWYDRQGPAAEVLQVGELPGTPIPARARSAFGCAFRVSIPVTPRSGAAGSAPRCLSRGSSRTATRPASRTLVGAGVEESRLGQRVWVFGAQSYRPFGTAAQLTVVPAQQAIDLPDRVSDELGACLGIPGITAHRAVFADGPVDGLTVLVHGRARRGSARWPRSSHGGAAPPSSG